MYLLLVLSVHYEPTVERLEVYEKNDTQHNIIIIITNK